VTGQRGTSGLARGLRGSGGKSVGEWMRKVGEQGASALREIIRDFMQWVLSKCKVARPPTESSKRDPVVKRIQHHALELLANN
jgi:hypothetical protein